MSTDEQRRRLEAAKGLGCEDGEALNSAFRKIVGPAPPSEKSER